VESPHLENIVRGQVTKLPRPKELRAVDVSYVSNVQALPLFRKSIKLEMLEMSWIFLLRLGYSGFQYWSQFASRNPASWCGRKLEQPLKKTADQGIKQGSKQSQSCLNMPCTTNRMNQTAMSDMVGQLTHSNRPFHIFSPWFSAGCSQTAPGGRSK
jgi:hypothetical protein